MRSVRIPLNSRKHPGLYAIVDEADAELVSQYRWHVLHRSNDTTFYASTNVKQPDGTYKTRVQMHRLILDLTDPLERVDHINHDGLDNTRANLRVGTHQQNCYNSRRKSHSKQRFKGIVPDYRKWRARIRVNGKETHLGNFETEEEAARAYDAAAREHYGEFACLNFPDEVSR